MPLTQQPTPPTLDPNRSGGIMATAAAVGELDRLDRMIESLYPIPDDLALARVADTQGLGGSSRTRASR